MKKILLVSTLMGLVMGLAVVSCVRQQQQPVSYTMMDSVVLDENRTSSSYGIGHARNFSIYCTSDSTDTPTGTMALQVSVNDSDWENYDTYSIAGAATKLWNVADAGYGYIRLNYTSSSGGDGSDCDCTLLIKE